jgi:lysophospholipase L1-like esterase
MKFGENTGNRLKSDQRAAAQGVSRRGFLTAAGAVGLGLTLGSLAKAAPSAITAQNPDIAALAAQSIGYKPVISGVTPAVSTSTVSRISAGAAQPVIVNGQIDTRYRFSRMSAAPAASTGLLSSYVTSGNNSDPAAPAIVVVEFIVDGSQVELIEYANQGESLISVDGVALSSAPTVGPSGNAAYYRLLDFGGVRAQRSIRVEYGGTYFGGINIGDSDTLYYPSKPQGTFAIVLGDELTVGYDGYAAFTSFAFMLGDLLGWNAWPVGSVGSGYVAGASNHLAFADRVKTDVIPYAPEIVVVQGGTNDAGTEVPVLSSAVSSLFSALQTGLPNAEIIAVGPFSPVSESSTSPNLIEARNEVQLAAANAGITFVDLIGMITGTGNVSSPQATGNANYYIAAGGQYPTQNGHGYLARRIASELVAAYSF